MSRQGQSFATAQEVRVVYTPKEGEAITGDEVLVDVPNDGKTIGEIVTRGNIVMQEYYKDPEATKKAFRGGYFWSGDLAVMHPDGAVAIMDRSKDIIISGGEVRILPLLLSNQLTFAAQNASSVAIEQGESSYFVRPWYSRD